MSNVIFINAVPVQIGVLSSGSATHLALTATSATAGIACEGSSTAARTHAIWRNPNGVVGSISTSGTTTTYATSSDYRLKENVAPVSGAQAVATIEALTPVTFNFISEPGTLHVCFIAHDLQLVVPAAVVGIKDAMSTTNPAEILPQGVDYSVLVPHLVACIKNLLARVAALEGV